MPLTTNPSLSFLPLGISATASIVTVLPGSLLTRATAFCQITSQSRYFRRGDCNAGRGAYPPLGQQTTPRSGPTLGALGPQPVEGGSSPREVLW